MSKYLDNDGLLYLWQKIKLLLAGKVDVVSGKGLSTNDYTTEEKNKLAGIAAGADVSTQYSAFDGATSSEAGTSGLVPAPSAGDNLSFLRGNGTWATPSDQQIDITISSASSGERPIIAATTPPTLPYSDYSGAVSSGTKGSIPASEALRPTINLSTGVLSAPGFSGSGAGLTNISASALPAATQSAQGAMSAADKMKLDAFSAASNYALKTDITSMYKHKGSVSTVNDLPASNNTEGDVYNVTATGMNYVWVVTNGTGAWDALGEVFTIASITNAEIDTILAT